MGRKKSVIKEEEVFFEVRAKLDFELDEYQKNFVKAINNVNVVFVDAPSGTGKTTLAVYMGLEFLRKGISERILYLRFVDDKYLQNGYLSGDLEEKTKKLFEPFFDAIYQCGIGERGYKELVSTDRIKLTTDTAFRGINLKNTFLIVDEAQNAKSINDLRMVLTRLHDGGSKAIIIGHSGQNDNKKVELVGNKTPFQVYQYHMSKKPFTRICELKNNYRGEISKWADSVDESIKEL